MKVIIHYRDSGAYLESNDKNLDEENIISFLIEGQFKTIVDIREYEFDLDNQDDNMEFNPDEEKFMNCFLIMEIENDTDLTKISEEEINRAFFKNLKETKTQLTQNWTSGNEQFYVVEMN